MLTTPEREVAVDLRAGHLGITLSNATGSVPGLLVEAVHAHDLAANAGIKAEDVIIALNDNRVTDHRRAILLIDSVKEREETLRISYLKSADIKWRSSLRRCLLLLLALGLLSSLLIWAGIDRPGWTGDRYDLRLQARGEWVAPMPAPLLDGLRTWYEIASASAGKYDGCAARQAVFWVVLGGHLRTLSVHHQDTKRFVHGSAACSFVAVLARERVAQYSLGHGAPLDNSSAGREYLELNATEICAAVQSRYGDNLAYLVGRPVRRLWAHLDTWYGGLLFLRALERHHGIAARRNDVVLFSRPDVIFTSALDAAKLHDLATRMSFIMYLPHSASGAGMHSNDPSEILMISPVETWARSVAAESRPVPTRCGRMEAMLAIPNVFANATPFYIGRSLGLWLHRVHGTRECINHCPRDRSVRPSMVVDVTKDVRCFFPDSACAHVEQLQQQRRTKSERARGASKSVEHDGSALNASLQRLLKPLKPGSQSDLDAFRARERLERNFTPPISTGTASVAGVPPFDADNKAAGLVKRSKGLMMQHVCKDAVDL